MEAAPVREVPLHDWGKALLEELLFRAAEAVSAVQPGESHVEVSLTFRLTANVTNDCLEIVTDGGAEAPLVTRLPRPF